MTKLLPLYAQLADTLKNKIYSGAYAMGDSLPSEREMALQYGISHFTVRKALDVLERDGVIIRMQGKGTFVKSPQLTVDLQSMGSFSSIARGRNSSVRSRILYSGIRKAKFKYAHIFGIDEDCDVYESIKLKISNDIALAVEYTTVPLKYVPDIAEYDYNVYSLYDVYAKNNIDVAIEDQKLEIVTIYNPIASLLDKKEGDSIFLLTSYAYNRDGNLIEYTRLYDNDDRMIFCAHGTNIQGSKT